MFILLLGLILGQSKVVVNDMTGDVSSHYADFICGEFTYRFGALHFRIEVDRLFENYSGPIYLFINSDGDDLTGWRTTEHISEDSDTIYGADLMLRINQFRPDQAELYRLNTDGHYLFLEFSNCTITNKGNLRYEVSGRVTGITGNPIKLRIFMNDEGNWGDRFPDSGVIELRDPMVYRVVDLR